MRASKWLVLTLLTCGVLIAASSAQVMRLDEDGVEGSFEVTSPDGSVTVVPGELPSGNSSSPVQVENFFGNETFIPGGSNRFTGDVTGGTATGLVVGFEGVNGYFEIALSQTSFEFTISLSQDWTGTALALVVVPVLGEGSYGQALRVERRVQMVGTGNLQVSLSWDTPTDVDLHVVEPSGEEIYYSSRSSSAGGELDLDSNAGCALDNVNNENVTYGKNEPPAGTYSVRVDYYAACAVSDTTHYLVTVNQQGQNKPTVYEGVFGPEDEDGGGAGSGVTVVEFEY